MQGGIKMAYVEQLLGEQGEANRRLGEEILRQRYLEAIQTAANQPKLSRSVYGGTCPFCCGDLDDVAFLKTGAAACLFCGNRDLAVEQSQSPLSSLQVASAVASRFAQGQAQRASE
jgi:hypothetical protein